MGVTPSARDVPAAPSVAATDAAIEAPIEHGTDPRPDAPTDPQPMRGPRK
jgi:hypothetical protein